MRSIMGSIGPEQLELFALESQNIAELDFVYTQASTDINQSASNWVSMFGQSKCLDLYESCEFSFS